MTHLDPFHSYVFMLLSWTQTKKWKYLFSLYEKFFGKKKKPTQNLLRNAGMFCFDIFSQNKMLADSQIKIFNFGVLN